MAFIQCLLIGGKKNLLGFISNTCQVGVAVKIETGTRDKRMLTNT